MVKKKSHTILLIDRDSRRRNNTSSRLRVQDVETELATGGFHAIHLIENNQYDVVIVVEDMEDMSGEEIMGLIRTQFDGKKLPILYSAETKDEDTILNAIEIGASDFLPLSANFNELIKKIEKLTFVPESKPKKKPQPKAS